MFDKVDDKFGERGLVADVGLDEDRIFGDRDGGLGFLLILGVLRDSHKSIIA